MAANTEALSVADQNGIENAQTVSCVENVNPTDQTSTDQTPAKNDKKKKSYEKNYPRVSKENLYMIIALWMEDFVDEAPKDHKKVGAVLVLPNDVIFAADCSRDGVHAVARLLMKHCDKAKGCKIFMSRKPCPLCAKLLVQSKVERVLFLPFEPEYYRWPESPESDADKKTREEINESNKNQVDNLFTASAIAQTRFVLQVEEPVVERERKKTPEEKRKEVDRDTIILMNRYSAFTENQSEWMKFKCIEVTLSWPGFEGEMKEQVRKYFEKVIDWIARVLVLRGRGLVYAFKRCEFSKPLTDEEFDPVNDSTHEEQARHFMTIAHFLSQRTDDPKTGVGAVIVSSTTPMEILALGWNGFPLKAQYGEFARASKSDESSDDKKYPYIIHAEQNALLMRNKKNIKDAIVFVTKPPCNECAPLIAMQGVKTVVVDDEVKRQGKPKRNELGYDIFSQMVEDGTFVCYQTKQKLTGTLPDKAKIKMDFQDAAKK
jgi:deoxycytidylate deaminase